jgi:hypothetical protein
MASALGALVLGVGGRVLMRIIALASGSGGGFSLAGSLEVVAAGALFGALGGLVLLILDRAGLHRRRALNLTAALFFVIGLVSDAARGAASRIPTPGRWLALGAFGGLLLLYSMLLLWLARRWASDSHALTRSGRGHATKPL